MTTTLPPDKPKPFRQLTDKKGRPVTGYFVHVPSGFIHVRKKFKRLGIPPFRETTKEKTLGKAKTVGQLLIQRHINKHLGVDDSNVLVRKREKTFGAVCDWTLENYTKSEVRAGTELLHKRYVGELKGAWGDRDINAITVETFNALIDKFRKTKKRRTFFDYQKAANLVMRKAYEKQWATHLVRFPDPDKVFRRKLEKKQAQRQKLTPEEQEILELKSSRLIPRSELDALWKVMDDELRDEFSLAFDCMMRLREGLHLEWPRCNTDMGIITLRPQDVKTGSKTGKGRTFMMHPRSLERMRARRQRVKNRSRYVFTGWAMKIVDGKKVKDLSVDKPVNQNKTAWRTAKKNAGIKERTRWHDLRHTALTHALLGDPALPEDQRRRMRKDPLLVSEYAGVSLKTIQTVYLKTDPHATREVVEEKGPVRLT